MKTMLILMTMLVMACGGSPTEPEEGLPSSGQTLHDVYMYSEPSSGIHAEWTEYQYPERFWDYSFLVIAGNEHEAIDLDNLIGGALYLGGDIHHTWIDYGQFGNRMEYAWDMGYEGVWILVETTEIGPDSISRPKFYSEAMFFDWY